MTQNPMLDAVNKRLTLGPNFPTYPGQSSLSGLPIGLTAAGELAVKVIVVANSDITLSTLPTVPGAKGTLYNNNGKPDVSP